MPPAMANPNGRLESPPFRNTTTSPHSPHRSRPSIDDTSRKTYTLTACFKCRERKSRCDTGIPKCAYCENHGVNCEYWDAVKKRRFPRRYILDLQNKVKSLEADLAKFNIKDDANLEPEEDVRTAAVVEFRRGAERKYLGPSSGTTMTRLVMRLAKRVIGARSIHEVISSDRLRQINDRAAQDVDQPTSKRNPDRPPLVASYAEDSLPGRELVTVLVRLYNVQVQAMYPVFHEPSLLALVDSVLEGSEDPYEKFVTWMIIAIGLQKHPNLNLAGAGDSYYLGALSFLEDVVRRRNIQTLQCFVLIGEYSLLTPTRTAIFFIIGLAMRLLQDLGFHQEHTIANNQDGSAASVLEVDLRRRAYWAVVTMDYGLAHSLGRPSIMATLHEQDHVNVAWFAEVEDEFICPHGILPCPISTRKWIAIHFYKMRLLQLEIRRALYLEKRPTPTGHSDPWFEEMHNKLLLWKRSNPHNDHGSGLSDVWFTGRYNTMVVLLYRPSPQVPRPPASSALRCYEACRYNVYMQRDQIATKSVELTWAFTQTLFMDVNTILWALSYAEVRQQWPRDLVLAHLHVALESLELASARWPGVEPALPLYRSLIEAIMPIFDREGDLAIEPRSFVHADQLSTHDDAMSNRSRTASPVSASQTDNQNSLSPRSPPLEHQGYTKAGGPSDNAQASPYHQSNSQTFLEPSLPSLSPGSDLSQITRHRSSSGGQSPYMESQYTPMPSSYAEMGSWRFSPSATIFPPADSAGYFSLMDPMMYAPSGNAGESGANADSWMDYEDAINWSGISNPGDGLSQDEQTKLMQDLESNEIGNISTMIQHTQDFFNKF